MVKPRGTIERSSTPSPGLDTFFELEELRIAAWCPDAKAEEPPEQVHLISKLQELNIPIIMRFKGPDTLGFLIEELAKYRREVWPDCEPLFIDERYSPKKKE